MACCFGMRLSMRWPEYSSEPVDTVSDRALRLVDENRDWLPPDLLRFAGYMRANRLFAAYARQDMIEHVLNGMSRRVTRANPLGDAGSVLWKNTEALDAGFAEFFPQLQAEAASLRAVAMT